jgi:hypothetical protein
LIQNELRLLNFKDLEYLHFAQKEKKIEFFPAFEQNDIGNYKIIDLLVEEMYLS